MDAVMLALVMIEEVNNGPKTNKNKRGNENQI